MVTLIAWPANGVVLVVGYSGGHLCLFEIDKSEQIHSNQTECAAAVTCLSWNDCRPRESDRAAAARSVSLGRQSFHDRHVTAAAHSVWLE